jgi:hypothetical protein
MPCFLGWIRRYARTGDKSYILCGRPGHSAWSSISLEPFANENLSPLIARILGLDITNLKTGPVDGKLGVLERSLTATRVISLAARKMRSRQLFPLSSI